MMFRRLFIWAFLCLQATPAQTEAVNFTRDIAPILSEKCFACHGPDAEKRKAGLRLNEQDGALAELPGGGAAVVPGRRADSALWKKVSAASPEERMPPADFPKKLSPQEIELLGRWIDEGALWDTHWALKPLLRPGTPSVEQSEWPRNSLDAFILARLEAEDIAPAPEADARTLLRRLSFDLLGLPPAPEEVAALVQDCQRTLQDPALQTIQSIASIPDEVYERMVDRMLASPRYGERWARHWLDVAHYADTHGYDKDKRRDHAWPYRDYVIQSLNDDKPYGRFVEEQLAGDVLYPEDPQATVALGFIAAGPWDLVGQTELREGTVDKKITRLLDRDDMVSTAMGAFTSLTVGCARCHDHKFDPISQQEYYGLQAVFAGIDRADRPYDSNSVTHLKRRDLLQEQQAQKQRLSALNKGRAAAASPDVTVLREAVTQVSKQIQEEEKKEQKSVELIEKLKAEREKVQAKLEAAIDAAWDAELVKERAAVSQRLAEIDAGLAALPAPGIVYAASSYFSPMGSLSPPEGPREVFVLARGDVNQPMREAVPGALACVPGLQANFASEQSGREGERRAALAHWIADPRNCLTWRSIVNRVWQYHFGRGIVETPNDFGHMGALPSHPELLDWLALEFLEHGQSLKWLHKLIVTSATYRQACEENQAYAERDGSNQLLWRMNRRQLEVEALRDAMLQASGCLDLTMGGPGVDLFAFEDDHSPRYLYEKQDTEDPKTWRRTIYRFIVRSVPDPLMDTLDCADPSQSVPMRNSTITALQSLALLNNPFVVSQAGHLAERLQREAPDLPAQIQRAYALTLCRAATPEEEALLLRYTAQYDLTNMCRLLLNSNEFMFVD